MPTLTHINPASMHRNPAFTQAIRVPAGHDLVVIGGQNGVDGTGQIVGEDLASQTKQALRNLLTCLDAAGGEPHHLVHWRILVKQGEDLLAGFGAFQEVWGERPDPPAITFAFVSGLGVPGALCEIEALAAVPA